MEASRKALIFRYLADPTGDLHNSKFFSAHYIHSGHAQVSVGPDTVQTLGEGQSDAAHMHESGLPPPHGLSAHEFWTPTPIDRCRQICPGMHMKSPQGTCAHAEVWTFQTSFVQVASALLVPNAHS
jgi:hypothetical protein